MASSRRPRNAWAAAAGRRPAATIDHHCMAGTLAAARARATDAGQGMRPPGPCTTTPCARAINPWTCARKALVITTGVPRGAVLGAAQGMNAQEAHPAMAAACQAVAQGAGSACRPGPFTPTHLDESRPPGEGGGSKSGGFKPLTVRPGFYLHRQLRKNVFSAAFALVADRRSPAAADGDRSCCCRPTPSPINHHRKGAFRPHFSVLLAISASNAILKLDSSLGREALDPLAPRFSYVLSELVCFRHLAVNSLDGPALLVLRPHLTLTRGHHLQFQDGIHGVHLESWECWEYR